MLTSQGHRGPNAEGIQQDGPVVLGHRRLSIIDLSEAGRQPMNNEIGEVWITFNGEIYNYRELRHELLQSGHRFRSESDSEVLVHGYEEWGIERLLQRLRGMYAFALYDQRQAEDGPFLFLARDRLGIKPLYYADDGEKIVFASEVRALRKSGAAAPATDLDALIGFICLGSVPCPRTYLKGVRCLPPGHLLAVGRHGAHLHRYWDLSYETEAAPQHFSSLLDDAVSRHLISDVPIGVFLSGGVDSAGLVALATRYRQAPLTTLTVTFDEAEYDEASAARHFAECFGTDHHEIRVTAEDFLAEIPKFLSSMDQPTADGVNTYFVSRAAKQLGLTVVLSGLGGDEVFFGYPHYRRLVQSSSLAGYSRAPSFLRRVVNTGAALYGSIRGQERWRRFDYLGRRDLHEGLYLLMRGFFAPQQAAELLGISTARVEESVEESFQTLRTIRTNGSVDPHRFHYLEMKRYLHDQLLRDSDVFSMAHSIELRVPYLDHEVVQQACQIPAAQKISLEVNKPKLLDAVGHPAVSEAARRPKQGFTFPFDRWMRTHADTLEERALAGDALDPTAVRHCWRQFRDGRLHWSRAWATVTVAAGKN